MLGIGLLRQVPLDGASLIFHFVPRSHICELSLGLGVGHEFVADLGHRHIALRYGFGHWILLHFQEVHASLIVTCYMRVVAYNIWMSWPFLTGARGRQVEPLLGPPCVWELEPSWLLLILILQQPLAHHIGLLCHLHASLLLLVLNKHIAAIWLGTLVALHYFLLATVHVDLVGREWLLLLNDLILCHIILAGIARFTCVTLLSYVVGQDVLVEVHWAVVCCGPVLGVVLVAAVI